MKFRIAKNVLGLLPRFLMIAVCLMPCSSPRQFASALAMSPPPASSGPIAPLNENQQEEEESERIEDAKGRVGHHSHDPLRPLRPGVRVNYPRPGHSHRFHSTQSCPAPVDPFRNGLGSPYRC